MDYYSPFWGPKAIFMVVELQGALTCLSSTITVWADSGPFLGLLLYIGVSESFRRLTNPGMRHCVGHQHSFFVDSDPFRGLLPTVLRPHSDFRSC